MASLVIVLRLLSLLAFAGPMLMLRGGRRHGAPAPTKERGSPGRAPVLANFLAFGLFIASLLLFAASPEAPMALPLAAAGCFLACAGAALVLHARAVLGSAWSLLPKANLGLVTTGPYALVRHPIYLGLGMLAMGQAAAFSSWPAGATVLCAVVPTLIWRAHAEERLLRQTRDEQYFVYRQRTKMIVPYVL